jgi:hypothetical protein
MRRGRESLHAGITGPTLPVRILLPLPWRSTIAVLFALLSMSNFRGLLMPKERLTSAEFDPKQASPI